MSTTRECGCPPWVVRCAHFDGQMLCLFVAKRVPEGCRRCNSEPVSQYATASYEGSWGPCLSCGEPAVFAHQLIDAGQSDTLDAARDEFRRREAELLGREA